MFEVNGKMTAAVLYGKEDIKIEQVPIPRVGESIEIFAGENTATATGVVRQITYHYSSHDVAIFFERGAPGRLPRA